MIALVAALLIGAAEPPPAEVFVGSIAIQGKVFGVMKSTEVTLDGRPTAYADVPDETTELVEIGLDLRRHTVTRLVYVTRRDTE